MNLCVQFGKNISIMHTSLLHISHSSLLDNVPHQEPLDSLILRTAFCAVGAADVLDVAAPVLVATAIPPLERHGWGSSKPPLRRARVRCGMRRRRRLERGVRGGGGGFDESRFL